MANLDSPAKKEIAMQLVSAAENSSLNWRAQFGYIEDIGDGRGYTAGIIGFCSGTGDMLKLVQSYTKTKPNNVLAKYLPALRRVNGTDSHDGLDPNFPGDWKTAAADPVFKAAQEAERDRVFTATRGSSRSAGELSGRPAQGGNEIAWLNVFLDERVEEMKKEEAHSDTSRVDTAQRVFLQKGNLDLNTPLSFAIYSDNYTIN